MPPPRPPAPSSDCLPDFDARRDRIHGKVLKEESGSPPAGGRPGLRSPARAMKGPGACAPPPATARPPPLPTGPFRGRSPPRTHYFVAMTSPLSPARLRTCRRGAPGLLCSLRAGGGREASPGLLASGPWRPPGRSRHGISRAVCEALGTSPAAVPVQPATGWSNQNRGYAFTCPPVRPKHSEGNPPTARNGVRVPLPLCLQIKHLHGAMECAGGIR